MGLETFSYQCSSAGNERGIALKCAHRAGGRDKLALTNLSEQFS